MSISGRVGIIGFPVAHSLSPKIHNAALQSLGLDISYELWKTSEENLDQRIEMLRAPDILGANVTVPFKQKIIPFLDDLEGFAKEIGAVNTIIKRNGLLIGKNTDAEGFVIPLEKELNKLQLDFSQVRTLLIGAGGASRAIAFALAKAGIPNITIMNRTLESAKELAHSLSLFSAQINVDAYATISSLEGFNCIINATSIGMTGGLNPNEQPCDLSDISSPPLVVDIVYAPEETLFLKSARDLDFPRLGGIPMLIQQAALSFELWTGEKAPLNTMRSAIEDVV